MDSKSPENQTPGNHEAEAGQAAAGAQTDNEAYPLATHPLQIDPTMERLPGQSGNNSALEVAALFRPAGERQKLAETDPKIELGEYKAKAELASKLMAVFGEWFNSKIVPGEGSLMDKPTDSADTIKAASQPYIERQPGATNEQFQSGMEDYLKAGGATPYIVKEPEGDYEEFRKQLGELGSKGTNDADKKPATVQEALDKINQTPGAEAMFRPAGGAPSLANTPDLFPKPTNDADKIQDWVAGKTVPGPNPGPAAGPAPLPPTTPGGPAK